MSLSLSSSVRPAMRGPVGIARRSGRVSVRRSIIAMADKPRFEVPEVNAPKFDKEAMKENVAVMQEKAKEFAGDAAVYWEKLEDKPTAVALGFVALFALYTGATMVNAIDRLPLLGGFFEIVGIGASGYFAYNILSSPEGREEWLSSIKDTFEKMSIK